MQRPAPAAQPPRAVAHREGFGLSAQIRQAQALMATNVTIDHAMLVSVLQGRKIIRNAKGEAVVEEGEFLVLAPGVYDSFNEPGETGPYVADWIIFAPEMLRAQREDAGRTPPRPVEGMRRLDGGHAGLQRSFAGAREALTQRDAVPDAVLGLRLQETLAWLRELGVVLVDREPGFDQVVRALIARDPARSWTAAELAAVTATSEATFRRKLSRLGASLSAIQTDTRMIHALNLLQQTDQPINLIALDVGYESASRFAIRFRQRFGFAPSDVRNRRPRIDRIGAECERLGAAG